jgi:hypothetical protein
MALSSRFAAGRAFRDAMIAGVQRRSSFCSEHVKPGRATRVGAFAEPVCAPAKSGGSQIFLKKGVDRLICRA